MTNKTFLLGAVLLLAVCIAIATSFALVHETTPDRAWEIVCDGHGSYSYRNGEGEVQLRTYATRAEAVHAMFYDMRFVARFDWEKFQRDARAREAAFHACRE